MNRTVALILFVAVVLGGGLVIGSVTAPGTWYAELNKPSFNPPGWLFGPVWTVLYIAIGIAGWLVWQARDGGTAMLLWWVQLALNFAWSPAFFSVQQIGLALAIIVALLLTIIGFIAVAWPRSKTAAMLFLPYAAWVAFATMLNGTIFMLN